jgi:hypothetical protein
MPAFKNTDQSGSMTSPFFAALAHWRMVFALAAAGAAFLTAVANLVYGRPGAALGFVIGNATFFVAFLYVFGHSFLLVRVFIFVASWHNYYLL